MRSLPSLILGLFLLAPHAAADKQLDSLKNISAAGAPFLTLKMLDQAQPSIDRDLYEWILWEQERLRILDEWEQWNDLLVRVESLPPDVPVQFQQQASTYQIKAYIALGQNLTARRLLRQQLWQDEAGDSAEYRSWRQLVIETYLNEDRVDDARIAMLRLQQDYADSDKEWQLLRARVLIKAGRFEEAIELLKSRLDWQSLTLKLLAEYRAGLHKPTTLWDLAKKRIDNIQDDELQLASYWSLAVIAAESISTVNQVIALESRLGIDRQDNITPTPIDADQLWRAYLDYARLVGNRSELLMGDDQSWLEVADNARLMTPIKARSLYALLITESPQEAVRNQAAGGFLKTLKLEQEAHKVLLDQVFNRSQRFSDAAQIPVQIRFQLVDMALKNADIIEATRLMSDLNSIPPDTRELDWLLRQARVLLLGGKLEQGNDVLVQLLQQYQEPNEQDTDRILQVLFDLQSLQMNDKAIQHFRKLLNLSIEPIQRRESLFWRGDSFKAMEEYQRAALMYLQSAMFTGPESMDPWAQTARFNAAESLQKAGLVDDARRIYQSLLKVTEEPTRRSVLRHKIQQLWLTQGSG